MGDLLDQPNTYFYSEFSGFEFLKAWSEHRLDISHQLADAPKTPAFIGHYAPGCAPYNAHDLFAYLSDCIRAQPEDTGEYQKGLVIAEKLLKHFEVTKHIYEAYTESIRAVDRTRFRSLSGYVEAAFIFHRYFVASDKLPFLNGLLKIMDIIAAHISEVDPADRAHVRWLLDREREHIEHLMQTNLVGE